MINLLPPSIKQDVKFAKYNVTLVEYAIVLAATVAIVAFLMLFGEQNKDLHHTIKSNIRGGLSVVFFRYQQQHKTKIKEEYYKE